MVLGHDLLKSPYVDFDDLPIVVHATISTGGALSGSTVAGGVQLGSPRVFMRDLGEKTFQEGLATSTRIVAPDGEFLAASGPEFAAQRIYHLYQSFYDISDRYLSAPGDPTRKQWDSHRGGASSFTPGTYRPRVGVFTSSDEPCRGQPACAGAYPVNPEVPPELVEFKHTADGGNVLERIGYTHFRNNDVSLDTIAHEFGHVVDSFLFPGLAASNPCMPGVDCVAKCVEDTPDEAPALNEAVAQLLALLYWYEASAAIDSQDCEAVDWISHNSSYAETPGACMADLGQIAYMARDGACPVLDDDFCDKPETDGYTDVCCELGVDPGCVEIKAGCAGKGGGVKSAPTGACSTVPGYRSNSTLEAFWQLLIGQECAPEAPFACVPIALPDGVSASEAAARALFYALRVNSRSFRQLFNNVAAYYSCEYGADAYEGVRGVLCNHRIMDCAAPPPLVCGECGDAVVNAGEACDLTAVPVTCADLGFDGGLVSCTLACKVDASACFHVAPTEATPTEDAGGATGAEVGEDSGAAGTGGDTTGAVTTDETGGTRETSDPDGCSCRQGGGSTPGTLAWLGLVFLVMFARRRRDS